VENNGNTRDTRVYTGSGLHEDKNPCPIFLVYYDSLG
jgi:hypothetical protein